MGIDCDSANLKHEFVLNQFLAFLCLPGDTFPNVITGIVKDPRGNPLANILVEVKDEQGNAVRAFKTNALGQFASATPLSNGSFTIEFDDPREQNKFDTVTF